MVGPRPLPVAAAEHGEADALERVRAEALDPGQEALGVVGRMPLVGGGHDDDRALGRQPLDIVVHRCRGRGVALAGGLPGDPPGEGFAGAGVAAVEDEERRGRLWGGTVPDLGGEAALRGRGHRAARPRGDLATAAGVDVEAVRLQREGLGDLQLVARISHGQVEALQDHGQHELRFLEGEAAPDAGAHAVAEGLPGVRGQRLRGLRGEALGPERLGLVPDRRVAVQHRREDEQRVLRRDRIAARQGGRLLRGEREGGSGRPQPQGLLQDLLDVAQLRQVLDLRTLAAEHLVHDAARLLQDLRVLQQQVQGEGQEPARGLVTRDQEGHHLVADVLVREPLAGLRVAPLQHQVEEVVARGGVRIAPALRDQRVGDTVHQRDVGLVAALGPQQQVRGHPGAPRPRARLVERADHGGDEGMHLVLVEAVEPVVEGAQRDGVEGQPGHVVGDVDGGVRPEPLPAQEHLVGDVLHPVEHRADAERAEGRHQQAVGLGPVRLLVVGREQAVAGEVADHLQRLVHLLGEASLVADLVHEFLRAQDGDGPATDGQPVDWPVRLREAHHALDRRARVDVRQVAEDRYGAGLWNVGVVGLFRLRRYWGMPVPTKTLTPRGRGVRRGSGSLRGPVGRRLDRGAVLALAETGRMPGAFARQYGATTTGRRTT